MPNGIQKSDVHSAGYGISSIVLMGICWFQAAAAIWMKCQIAHLNGEAKLSSEMDKNNTLQLCITAQNTKTISNTFHGDLR
jgi:hypothetical protein